MTTIKTRLTGLAACAVIVLLIVGTPLVLIAAEAIPTPSDFSWSRLTAPDDGTLALVIVSGVAWIAWAVMVMLLVTEVLAKVRGLPAARLPGLTVPQLATARLVAVAALLFVGTPIAHAALSAPPAAGVSPAAPVPLPVATPSEISPATTSWETPTEAAHSTIAYTVKRGDSLWKIAQQHLGDGTRYTEIVALNRAVLNGQPDFINPGLVLRLPDERQTEQAEQYVVQPGDTLSEIAERELGDADSYPAIFEASRDTIQPDGRQVEDPDLILPNWKLTLPRPAERPDTHHDEPEKSREQADTASPTPTVTPEPTPQIAETDSGAPTVDDSDGSVVPGWALVGLTGAGAVLAGSMLLVLRQLRRTQLRYRTPGHILVPPPAELLDAERTAHLTGSVSAPRVDVLDRALRSLSSSCVVLPRLIKVELNATTAKLHLADAAKLLPPWAGEATAWSIDLDADVPESSGDLAPYPTLVSLGMNDAGALVLVNLEELGAVAVTGDAERVDALGRHLTAELSLNPWSTLLEIDTFGIGAELADIDPTRHRHHTADEADVLDRLASDIEAEDPDLDPDQFRAIIVASHAADAAAAEHLVKVVATYPGRVGAIAITIGLELEGSARIRLDQSGRLTLPKIGLQLDAAGLTVEEALACNTLIDLTRGIPDETTPPLAATELTTLGGALAPALTEPRPEGPAGERSMLPLPSEEYERVAATTHEDVEVLAPIVAENIAQQLSSSDPDLDEDVARWQSPHLLGPKLTLLGPVSARTLGDPRKMAHRRPFYTELLAFLTLNPAGATAVQISEAFSIQPERARKDVGILRGWLGTDTRTGKLHLPNARQTHAAGEGARYAVNDVATDLDLFQRLRTRGQSRGAAGIDDLRTALTLVLGEPFTDLRPTGWNWLFEGERLDHIVACAIVDTAHIVATHALAVGDFDLARFAAETGYLASPYDETSRLDLVAVDKASGDDQVANDILAEGILNRSDDDAGPVDVPAHTSRIIRQRSWTSSRSRSAG